MSTYTMPDDVRELFAGANYAHLATLRHDGSPRSWVVWVGVEGDHLLVCTGDDTWKARDMIADPRVSLSVCDLHNPYRMASVQGRVIEVRNDHDSEYMDAISHKYTGQPFPIRGPGRVCFVIEPIKGASRHLPFSHSPAR
jgi:PPOX class probable F420-dependent enzyme